MCAYIRKFILVFALVHTLEFIFFTLQVFFLRKHRFILAEFNLHATSVTFKLLGAVHILDAIVHTLVNSINLLPNWSGRF